MRMTRPCVSILRKLGTRLSMKRETSSPAGASSSAALRCDFGTNSPTWMKKYGSSSAMMTSYAGSLSLERRPLAIEPHRIQRRHRRWPSCARVPSSGSGIRSELEIRLLHSRSHMGSVLRARCRSHGALESACGLTWEQAPEVWGRVPRTVLLDVPPGQDLPESVRAHALAVHGDGTQAQVNGTGIRQRRRVRPLLDKEGVSRVKEHPGNAGPPAPQLRSATRARRR